MKNEIRFRSFIGGRLLIFRDGNEWSNSEFIFYNQSVILKPFIWRNVLTILINREDPIARTHMVPSPNELCMFVPRWNGSKPIYTVSIGTTDETDVTEVTSRRCSKSWIRVRKSLHSFIIYTTTTTTMRRLIFTRKVTTCEQKNGKAQSHLTHFVDLTVDHRLTVFDNFLASVTPGKVAMNWSYFIVFHYFIQLRQSSILHTDLIFEHR